jgi:hypothetical protein
MRTFAFYLLLILSGIFLGLFLLTACYGVGTSGIILGVIFAGLSACLAYNALDYR